MAQKRQKNYQRFSETEFFYQAMRDLGGVGLNQWSCAHTEEDVAAGKRPRMGIWGRETGTEMDGTPQVVYDNPDPQPTEDEIDARIVELKAAEPMEVLRRERDLLLEETDYLAIADRPEMSQANKDYRQALRDLPVTVADTLELDAGGAPIGFDWPVKPS